MLSEAMSRDTETTADEFDVRERPRNTDRPGTITAETVCFYRQRINISLGIAQADTLRSKMAGSACHRQRSVPREFCGITRATRIQSYRRGFDIHAREEHATLPRSNLCKLTANVGRS